VLKNSTDASIAMDAKPVPAKTNISSRDGLIETLTYRIDYASSCDFIGSRKRKDQKSTRDVCQKSPGR
jgi:hypothetical protein